MVSTTGWRSYRELALMGVLPSLAEDERRARLDLHCDGSLGGLMQMLVSCALLSPTSCWYTAVPTLTIVMNQESNHPWHAGPSPPPLYTLYTCILYAYSHREGGGEITRVKVRGATVHKAGSKIPTCWLYYQSINTCRKVENSNMTDCITSLYSPAAKSLYS